GAGVAANVLSNLGVDLRKVRMEVEKIVQAGPHIAPPRELPQTPRAKKVIEDSVEEARNLNHNYVGTEHLLLGLLRESEGVAAQVLVNLGLSIEGVRREILAACGLDPNAVLPRPADPGGGDFPAEVRSAVGPLDAQLEQLNQEKEAAVAAGD